MTDNDVAELNKQKRFITIYAGNTTHIYPISYFRDVVRGEPVDPIPTDVLRVIVRDWLKWLDSYVE